MSKNPNVYAVFGINGVGKSTVVNDLASRHEGVRAVHASEELSNALDGVTRSEMESMSRDEKLGALASRLMSIFDEEEEHGGKVLLDSHLIVSIRQNGDMLHHTEDLWTTLGDRVVRAVMLTADPSEILHRRLEDAKRSGRERSTSIHGIALDQHLNRARFDFLVSNGYLSSDSIIVRNNQGNLEETEEIIENIFDL